VASSIVLAFSAGTDFSEFLVRQSLFSELISKASQGVAQSALQPAALLALPSRRLRKAKGVAARLAEELAFRALSCPFCLTTETRSVTVFPEPWCECLSWRLLQSFRPLNITVQFHFHEY
jgi:hypothetical protein